MNLMDLPGPPSEPPPGPPPGIDGGRMTGNSGRGRGASVAEVEAAATTTDVRQLMRAVSGRFNPVGPKAKKGGIEHMNDRMNARRTSVEHGNLGKALLGGALGSGVDLKDGLFRARLVRFYTKYDAGKLRGVDAKMEQYKDGKEVQLFKALVKKYGPEPLEDDGGGGGSGELSNAETNGDDSLRDIEVRRIMSIGRRGMKPKLERRSRRFGGGSSKDDKNMFEPSSTGKNQALAAIPSRADKKRRGKKKTFAVESTEVRSHPRQVAQDSKGLAVGTDEMEGAVSSSVSRSQSIAL